MNKTQQIKFLMARQQEIIDLLDKTIKRESEDDDDIDIEVESEDEDIDEEDERLRGRITVCASQAMFDRFKEVSIDYNHLRKLQFSRAKLYRALMSYFIDNWETLDLTKYEEEV